MEQIQKLEAVNKRMELRLEDTATRNEREEAKITLLQTRIQELEDKENKVEEGKKPKTGTGRENYTYLSLATQLCHLAPNSDI